MEQNKNREIKIGIVGGGVVGGATQKYRSPMNEIVVYDTDVAKCNPAGTTFQAILSSDLIFVFVP